MKKTILMTLALLCAVALVLTGCSGKDTPATEATPAGTEVLELSGWTLDSSIWSSANGASVDLTATPAAYHEGMRASFVVKLDGAEVWNQACQWDGKAFTSYADLNATDGYLYYVVLTGASGTSATVDVNTAANPTNEGLMSLKTALESYCNITISDAGYENNVLTITQGSADIQTPRLLDRGQAVTLSSADLILYLDEGVQAKVGLDLPAELNTEGTYSIDIAGVSFTLPSMENDHQITLGLEVCLSNGLVLNDDNNTAWFYSDGTVSMTVG